jgi:hypothetical protein
MVQTPSPIIMEYNQGTQPTLSNNTNFTRYKKQGSSSRLLYTRVIITTPIPARSDHLGRRRLSDLVKPTSAHAKEMTLHTIFLAVLIVMTSSEEEKCSRPASSKIFKTERPLIGHHRRPQHSDFTPREVQHEGKLDKPQRNPTKVMLRPNNRTPSSLLPHKRKHGSTHRRLGTCQ